VLEIPPHVRRHWQVIRELERQTDRGVAIIGAAYLEERLEESLRAAFTDRIEQVKIDGYKVSNRLFKGTGPLATFSAKIDALFALGLVGERSFHDLHLVRYIRNAFAHTSDPLSFRSPKIADRCRKLWLPANILTFGAASPPTDSKEQFLGAVHMLYNFLWSELAKKHLVGDDAKEKPRAEVLP